MNRFWLFVVAVLSFPAQAITTGPLNTLPVNHPLAMLLLALVLSVMAFIALRKRPAARSMALVMGVGLVSLALWQSPALKAQLLASFSNPAGETLVFQVVQIDSGGDIAGFELEDFTNASGEPLTIRNIELPDFDACFPSGITGALLPPGAADPAPPPTCTVGNTLAAGATCRVDIDSHCRAEAASSVALTAVNPTSGTALGGTGFILTGVSLTGATAVTFDGVAAISVNAVNSTTVTGVTPAHAAGVVDVMVSTPAGNATLANGYTYEAPPPATLTAVNPTSGAASGGTGFTLTGTNLTGATGVTFDGVVATSVNVVNSTTVTGVTPAHAAGVVDVVISTPAGNATLANGYTYVATAVGQASFGGTIACLNGGLNNLIAATADNSTSVEWGGSGTAIGVGAQSITDGASNTTAIVATLGNNGGIPYAAQLCSNYETDSQGNTPCEAGNSCYNDWFLPAGNNATATGQLNCLFTNRVSIGGFANNFYWSSTESIGWPTIFGWDQSFSSGTQADTSKSIYSRARCVRAFTP
ncbi:MAG TPA: midcut-by-XrtH protein [Cellvibrionaceae bacterium]